MDPEQLQQARTKQWLEIYEQLKPGTALELRDSRGNIEDNLLNSAIYNNAPIHVINRIMDVEPGLVFKQNGKNYNLPLHFAIASPDPDIKLIRRIFDAFPEAISIENINFKRPFDVINPNLPRDNPRKYVQLGQLIADAKAAELLKQEDREQEKKSAKNLRQREKKAKKRESRAQLEREAKIQALTNRSKERQAKVIQRNFRRHLELQKVKKRYNLNATPFVPIKRNLNLPEHESVALPWDYDRLYRLTDQDADRYYNSQIELRKKKYGFGEIKRLKRHLKMLI